MGDEGMRFLDGLLVMFGVAAVAAVPLVLLGLGLGLARRLEERGHTRLARVMFVLSFSGGLDRMRRLMPRAWSDHPDVKYPRHGDTWPPR